IGRDAGTHPNGWNQNLEVAAAPGDARRNRSGLRLGEASGAVHGSRVGADHLLARADGLAGADLVFRRRLSRVPLPLWFAEGPYGAGPTLCGRRRNRAHLYGAGDRYGDGLRLEAVGHPLELGPEAGINHDPDPGLPGLFRAPDVD